MSDPNPLANESRTPIPFDQLPSEMIQYAINYMQPEDLQKIGMTSTRLNEEVNYFIQMRLTDDPAIKRFEAMFNNISPEGILGQERIAMLVAGYEDGSWANYVIDPPTDDEIKRTRLQIMKYALYLIFNGRLYERRSRQPIRTGTSIAEVVGRWAAGQVIWEKND
ncbi:hypothetical protein HG421_12580 [Xanthomonas campestris pv. badrii]|uniref:F-box domain-containing protein n=1 Tax=Xanthomonas campestris pv. badrii TaxID=149696 RepID=A0A7Z2VB94_XANCA|nr:hypothetical protein [Xanthomonas campestris]QJD68455.1 hypothetical protein HG421_12580 [Xanthomonas campestris pv. badrii]